MVARVVLLVMLISLAGCVSEPLPEGFERSSNFDQVEAAKTRISLGLTYLKNGNYTQAKINLDKALEFAPRLADAHYSIAYYYQLVEENARAEESYNNALKLDSDNADIANSYGAFLCQQGRYEEAKTYFLKAVNSQTYASSAETYENMALCSLSQEQRQDAIEYLTTALNHQPTRAKSLFLLAELQLANKDYNDAKQTLTRYQRVARVTAETLWMSIQIEEGLNQPQVASGYGEMLMRMYPGHPLTKRYLDNLPQAPMNARVQQKPKPEVVVPDAIVEDVSEVVESTPTVAEQLIETPVVEEPVTEQQPAASVQAPTPTPDVIAEVDDMTDAASDLVTQHVVQAGDNLYRISLRYNVKMARLIEWNNLPSSGAIQRGMSLWVIDPATISE